MPKYKVACHQTLYGHVYVEAADEFEAQDKANERLTEEESAAFDNVFDRDQEAHVAEVVDL